MEEILLYHFKQTKTKLNKAQSMLTEPKL